MAGPRQGEANDEIAATAEAPLGIKKLIKKLKRQTRAANERRDRALAKKAEAIAEHEEFKMEANKKLRIAHRINEKMKKRAESLEKQIGVKSAEVLNLAKKVREQAVELTKAHLSSAEADVMKTAAVRALKEKQVEVEDAKAATVAASYAAAEAKRNELAARVEEEEAKLETFKQRERAERQEREKLNLAQALKRTNEKLEAETVGKQSARRAAQYQKKRRAKENESFVEEFETLKRKFRGSTEILEEEKKEMEAKLESFLQEVATMEDGKYVEGLRCLYYHLLTQNVKAAKIEPIIRCVLAFFCPHLEIGPLPARTTAGTWRTELHGVTLCQIGETFLDGKKDATLQQDDTTKKHEGFSAFEAAFNDESGEKKVFTLGLPRNFEKSAGGVARTMVRLLEDVETVNGMWVGKQKAAQSRVNLVGSLTNTMSYRGAVAVSFVGEHFAELRLNELLRCEKFSDFILKSLGMSEEEFRRQTRAKQLELMAARNFFCNDHYLVTQSTDLMTAFGLCERARWHKAGHQEPFVSPASGLDAEFLAEIGMEKEEAAGMPTVEVLVREASKGLSPQGACKKLGKPREFAAFVARLAKEGQTAMRLEEAKLVSFRGSRFNILFTNGAGWYALHDLVVKFLEEQKRADGNLNRLLQAILEKMRTSETQAALQVCMSSVFQKAATLFTSFA